MQTRCYTCGTLLHEGMPTLEELSDQQAGLVRGYSRPMLEGDPGLILVTIPALQGMSVHQFCTLCLDQVVNLDSRVWDKAGFAPHHSWSQKLTKMRLLHTEFICICGCELGSTLDVPLANRNFRQHLHEVLHPPL